MNHKKPSRRQLLSLCAELHDDDGLDPKDFFRSPTHSPKNDRRTRQLCGQVAATLSQVLSGECADDVLSDLQVMAVRPAPDASQLLVLVAPASPDACFDSQLALARLASANGWLRAEVAAAITRRKAPQLLFQLVSANYGEELQ